MTTYRDMEMLLPRIKDEDSSLPDNEIIELFLSWIPSQNCFSAADGYFWFLSSIAKYKPKVIELLLKKAIEPLYYVGYENSQGINLWASRFTESQDDVFKPSKSGKAWLLRELPKYNELIDVYLREYKAE